MGSPHRRTIYHASLEAHIDQLHEQLFSYSLEPVPLEDLSQYRGLNNQIARVRLTLIFMVFLADSPSRAW